jgi:predicted nucleic acid-binding Zn ribbon protein
MHPDESDEYDTDAHDPDDPESYPPGVYADDAYPTAPCPYCRQEIAEDAVACPRCGKYMSAEDAPRERKSLFWVVMMLLALAAVAFMTLLG